MKFTKTVLPNGLTVVTIPMADNPAVTVLVMTKVGSEYETKSENGISHFLEHMVFKGTPKRPKAGVISRELDGLGAEHNAFTSGEYTGYYAKVDSRHFNEALDIISDMYLNPLLPEEEIKKEAGVIVEEIKMYNDLPQQKVHNLLNTLMYGDTPAGRGTLGTEKTVRSFRHKDFVVYRNKHYTSSATTVIVSGSVDEKRALDQITEIFKKIQKKEAVKKTPVVFSQTKPKLVLSYKKTDQSHLVIGFRTFSIFDKRVPALRLLVTILGKGMSSRLFVKMREELGICYYINASRSNQTDYGDMTISAGVDNKRIDLAIKNILAELKLLTETLVPEHELTKAKDFSAGGMLLNLETSDAQAEFVGFQQLLENKIELPEKIISDMAQVTAEEIRDLAREIFTNKGLNMAIIGPYKDKKRFSDILTIN